jgi:hypothetical protein
MKKMLFILIVATFLVAGFFSTQWSVVNAQGTIPTEVPPQPTDEPVIPITGGTTTAIQCKDEVLQIDNVARVVFLECPSPSMLATMTVLTDEDVKLLKPLTFLTEVFQVTTAVDYQGRMIVGAELAPAEQEIIKKDPAYGLYRYDMENGKWERLVATLDQDGFLSTEAKVPGIFVVGKLPQ